MNTSLQNIITKQATSLHQSEVRRLFQKKDYPKFEIADFLKNEELIKKEEFVFFLKILEKWNVDAKRQDESLNDCAYTKNEFIFSWLKSLAVLDGKRIDSSLHQLFNWFNSMKHNEPTCYVKKEINNKSHIEQWEIRNSYKSNLPLEIDNYKRRFIFSQKKDHIDQIPLNRTAEQSPTFNKENNNFSPQRRHNNFVKNCREDEEVKKYLNNYRKNKVYFYKNMAKNYYKSEFERDKLTTASNTFPSKDRLYMTDQIKSYRIKTTIGSRPFETGTNAMSKTSYTSLSRCDSSNIFETPPPLNASQDCSFKFPLSNINGVGLIANPFEVKLKKKKK